MVDHAYLRILGYVVTLIVHITNIVYMTISTTKNPTKDKSIEVFKSLEYRCFTTWTFILQVVYAMFSLCCDVLTLINSNEKDYKLPKEMTVFRNVMFGGLVWPCSWIVFSVFWTLYIYDRSLIFPEYLDHLLTPVSNHVIHTFIIPVVVWELLFRRRSRPKTHARNIMQLTMHGCVYLSVLIFTYIERGVWLYPIFKKLYGTMYFGISIIIISILFLIFYYIQWPLTDMIHKEKENKVELKKMR